MRCHHAVRMTQVTRAPCPSLADKVFGADKGLLSAIREERADEVAELLAATPTTGQPVDGDPRKSIGCWRINEGGDTMLHLAARHGAVSVSRLLLEKFHWCVRGQVHSDSAFVRAEIADMVLREECAPSDWFFETHVTPVCPRSVLLTRETKSDTRLFTRLHWEGIVHSSTCSSSTVLR